MSVHDFWSRATYINLGLMVSALAIGILAVAPFFFSRHDIDPETNQVLRLISTHDLPTHVTIMKQFDAGLRSGVLYPRWLADTNHGYGVATLVYYPPNIFYLCSLIHLFVSDWINTLFVLAALSVALSGIALYALARLFYGRTASALAALVYMLLPYHQLDLYWRGALPEYVGFVFVPLILRYAYKLGSAGRFRDYAAVGLLYGLYVMTHLPVSYLFTYTLAFYALAWAFRERDWKILLRIGAGMALGLGVCAIYWLPAALESKAAYEWVSGMFNYHKSYLTLMTPDDYFTRLINTSFIFQVVAVILSYLILRADKDFLRASLFPAATGDPGAATTQTRMWLVMAAATIFMTTPFSIYLSKLIPRIEVAVPPFRWMLITSVFACLLLAAATERLLRREVLQGYWLWLSRAAMIALVVLSLGYTFGVIVRKALQNPTHIPPAEFEDNGWIPANASLPNELPKTEPVVIAEGGTYDIVSWQPQRRVINVQANSQSFLRLKTYNFPGWMARVDGQRVEIKSDLKGAQVFPIPAGQHRVEVEFVNTPVRNFATAITTASLLLVAALFALDFMKRRKRAEEPQETDVVAPAG
jgi:uncharacterized membrane protein